MQFAKLMTADGAQISEPIAVVGSLSFDSKTGEAHAWDASGRELLAELVGARVVWVGATGMRVEGLEPVDIRKTKFRAQSWHFSF